MVLFMKQPLLCLKKENRAISKTNARFQNKTSPTVDIEERVTSNINLEGLRFENRATPRTHSEGVHFGQYETSNGSNLDPGQSIVGRMTDERKIKIWAKTITVHPTPACDTLPSVE